MPVTVQSSKKKKKPAIQKRTKTKDRQIVQALNTYGALKGQADLVRAENKELFDSEKEAKSELLLLLDEGYLSNEKPVVSSEEYIGEFGMKANATSITSSAEDLKTALDDNFYECIKIQLTPLKTYLSKPELEKHTKTERTGNRSIKIIKK